MRGILLVRAAAMVMAGAVCAITVRGQNAGESAPTLWPAAGTASVCPDVQLRMAFDGAPKVGAGKIHVMDGAGVAIHEIDVSKPTAVKAIGGLSNFVYYPVLISGNEATICLPNNLLGYGKSYSIAVDAGAFRTERGPTAAVEGETWKFTTKAAAPAAGSAKLTVAADGTGDFCTLQGALDFVPQGNTEAVTILMKKGTYREIVFFTDKHHVTILGEDRKGTILAYATNDRFNNNANGNPFGAGSAPATRDIVRGSVYRRGMFLAHRCNNLTIANMTFHNTTPQGGSQAEAIILNGTPAAQAILANLDLISFQDTLQINGQAYIANCYIEGDVDFMWGTGPCFFEHCTARSLRSNAYYTQIRNPATNHGYVFSHCTFEGAAGVAGNFLSRIEPGRFPASEVVLLECTLSDAVGAAAWRFDAGRGAATAPGGSVHFWEYDSRDPQGKPVDVSKRFANSRQLKKPEDAQTIADYSNPGFVLGSNWTPKLPPNIQP